MKKIFHIFLFLVLGFCSASALPYEVQVPISSRQTSSNAVFTTSSARVKTVGCGGAYHPSQTIINMSSTTRSFSSSSVPTGHFTSYVPAVDSRGVAYAPGQESNARPHLRKVSHDDDEDDPYLPSNVAPVGDIPWWLLTILLLSFAAYRFYRSRLKNRIRE